MEGADGEIPIRAHPQDQTKFWTNATKMAAQAAITFTSKFQSVATKLDKDMDCFECDQSPSDVIMIMDESASMAK